MVEDADFGLSDGPLSGRLRECAGPGDVAFSLSVRLRDLERIVAEQERTIATLQRALQLRQDESARLRQALNHQQGGE